ncbi:Adenylosuccinate synthetase [Nemania sp. FL0031]|nr:Adenylosuccinate synthetase [Nemania sp. FL0031]
MPITVILGAQWGKLTDILAPQAQLCARAAGGHNAGHSIVANGVSYSFHLLPSGLINPKCMNFIGSGVVFHVPSFFKELQELEEKGLPSVHDRILVSDRVQINLDMHAKADGLEEKELGAARSGIRLAEVFHPELFESKLRRLAAGYRKRYGDLFEYDVEEELARFKEYRQKLAKYTVDGVTFIRSAQEGNMNIVVEGANALMLDIDYGSYPFVTSSNTTLAGIIGGLALNPKNITETIGVGTSTGRRRRYLVVVKYSASINYYTALNLTKLDVLDTFETIKIAIAYKIDGEELDSYPADLEILDRAEVVYHEMPGWQQPTTNITAFYDLPKKARDYVEYIENFVGVKIKWIGTGPDREAMIMRS